MNRSARSFHPGDTVTLLFDGEGFRLYGVTGPNGGIGDVVLPGMPAQTIDFHSDKRRTHALLYSSPRMTPGVHSAGIVVTRGYVNIDEVQILGRTEDNERRQS